MRIHRYPFRKSDLILVFAGVFLGISVAFSADLWLDRMENGRIEFLKSKDDLVRSAGLLEFQNAVYSTVGPQAWENEVKPDFLKALTYATISDTGNLFPEAKDVVGWVREHPSRARDLLEAAEKSHLARKDPRRIFR